MQTTRFIPLDPFDLDSQLTEDERMIRDTALILGRAMTGLQAFT